MIKEIKYIPSVMHPKRGNPHPKTQSILAYMFTSVFLLVTLLQACGITEGNITLLGNFVSLILGYYFGVESSKNERKYG